MIQRLIFFQLAKYFRCFLFPLVIAVEEKCKQKNEDITSFFLILVICFQNGSHVLHWFSSADSTFVFWCPVQGSQCYATAVSHFRSCSVPLEIKGRNLSS